MQHDCRCPVCGGQLPDAPITVLPERGMVVANGQFATLTGSEIAVLEILCRKYPNVVSKAAMMDHLYGDTTEEPEIKIVDVFVCKVRKKVSQIGVVIETSWGNGYSLRADARPTIVQEVTA